MMITSGVRLGITFRAAPQNGHCARPTQRNNTGYVYSYEHKHSRSRNSARLYRVHSSKIKRLQVRVIHVPGTRALLLEALVFLCSGCSWVERVLLPFKKPLVCIVIVNVLYCIPVVF